MVLTCQKDLLNPLKPLTGEDLFPIINGNGIFFWGGGKIDITRLSGFLGVLGALPKIMETTDAGSVFDSVVKQYSACRPHCWKDPMH